MTPFGSTDGENKTFSDWDNPDDGVLSQWREKRTTIHIYTYFFYTHLQVVLFKYMSLS